MENVIAERVKHATLTKAQQKIADYFIRNPERVGMCSSMEVAKEIGVSDASIIRFARAIGYEGFTDLKNDIYNSLAMQASGGANSLSLSERYEVNRSKYGGSGSREDYMKVLRYNQERTFQNIIFTRRVNQHLYLIHSKSNTRLFNRTDTFHLCTDVNG